MPLTRSDRDVNCFVTSNFIVCCVLEVMLIWQVLTSDYLCGMDTPVHWVLLKKPNKNVGNLMDVFVSETASNFVVVCFCLLWCCFCFFGYYCFAGVVLLFH